MDDDEKKGRRSSILKPQEPRNPLGDLDFGNQEGQDDDTTTLSRTTSSRRVSFARSNFVKQFAEDPEKNTIWDSTYEESVEKSSDHSSNLHVPDIIIEAAVTQDEVDMDITLAKEDVLIECSPNVSGVMNVTENKENEMQFTFAAGEKLQCVASFVDGKGLSNVSDNLMEFTEVLPVVCQNKVKGSQEAQINVSSQEAQMDFTEVLAGLCLNNVRDQEAQNNVSGQEAEMDFTEVLPGLYQNNVNNEDDEMEFTVVLPTNDALALSNGTVYFDTTIKNDSTLENIATNNNAVNSIEENCNVLPKEDISKEVHVQITILNTSNDDTTRPTNATCLKSQDNCPLNEDKSNLMNESCNKSKSATQTPLSSFHASLGESYDDTQHLINYNLSSKNQPKSDFSKIIANEYDPTFLNSQYLPLDINGDSFPVSLNSINSSAKHADAVTPVVDTSLKRTSSGFGLISPANDILERTGLEKVAQSHGEQEDINWGTDPFLKELFQKGLTISEPGKKNCDDVFENWQRNLNHQKSVCRAFTKKLSDLQTEYINQNEGNREDSSEDDSSTDISTDVENCSRRPSYLQDKIPDAVLSIKEKVKQRPNRCETCWNIISLEDGEYKFGVLHETITLTVKLNEDNGDVLQSEIEDNMSYRCKPIVLYLRKILVDRLSSSSLHSALGKKFEILSYLDYLECKLQEILSIKDEFDELLEEYAVVVDSNFSAWFTVVSVKLEQIWEFHFNLCDLNDMKEDSINVNIKMGRLTRSAVRKCLSGCPKGYKFIKTFIQNVYDLKRSLEQKSFGS